MKKRYDQHHKDLRLEMGSYVLVRLTPHEIAQYVGSKKLKPRWSSPAKVIRELSNQKTYEVEFEHDRKTRIVNLNLLLPLKQEVWDEGFTMKKRKTPAIPLGRSFQTPKVYKVDPGSTQVTHASTPTCSSPSGESCWVEISPDPPSKSPSETSCWVEISPRPDLD